MADYEALYWDKAQEVAELREARDDFRRRMRHAERQRERAEADRSRQAGRANRYVAALREIVQYPFTRNPDEAYNALQRVKQKARAALSDTEDKHG